MNLITKVYRRVKTIRNPLLLGILFMFLLINTPNDVTAQTAQQLTQQLSTYHVYDVFKDGAYIYVLASQPALNARTYSHPDGTAFSQKDMYILKIIPTGEIKSSKLDSALAIGTGTLSVDNNTVTAFINFKAADKSYDMTGVVFKIDKSTITIASKKDIFTNANAGWYPKILQNGIEHFSFSNYNRMLDTSEMGKVNPQTMEEEFNTYSHDHSGNILSVSSVTDIGIANNIATYIQSIDPKIIKKERAEFAAHQAAEAKEKDDFRKILLNKDPKKMYISAGKLEAKGEKAKAMQVYSAIMDRFPENDLAIKATDKFTALNNKTDESRTNNALNSTTEVPVIKQCGWTEGDTVKEEGKFLFADSCTIYGTVESVNKACNKVKVSVTKVTGAFGMRIDAACRYSLGQASERDLVWMNVTPK